MFDNIEIMRMASALGKHASTRQTTIARNIANADTPGYRASDIDSFQSTYSSSGDRGMRATRAGHIDMADRDGLRVRSIDAGGAAAPNGNNVSIETEMMKSAETKLQHDMATSIYKSSLDILRASIGRGR